jgi:hypothetical protein
MEAKHEAAIKEEKALKHLKFLADSIKTHQIRIADLRLSLKDYL